MATITRELDSGKAELRLHVSGTECKRDFDFLLRGNYIAVEPGRNFDRHNGVHTTDWYAHLTEQEKLDIFNYILAEYRQRSLGQEGFKLAALGITESGDIYISENTEQLSNDFYRQCAEQNMVTTATTRDVYRQIKENIRKGGAGDQFVPRNPKFRDVYVMGGRAPDIGIACPCGNCTDLLSKVMLPDSHIWVLPVNEGTQKLRINDNVSTADELDEGEAWKTTIHHLDKDYYVELDAETAALQQAALDDVIEHAEQWIGQDLTRDEMMPPENATEEELNRIMHKCNAVTLANRMHAVAKQTLELPNGIIDLDGAQRRQIVDDYIQWTRCSIAERDDGRRFLMGHAKSIIDKAMPSVEIGAIQALSPKLGDQGIRLIRGMECLTREDGKTRMRTSSKAALERAVKYRSKESGKVDFLYTPFNPGTLSAAELELIQLRRADRELFPSYFTGKSKPTQPNLVVAGGVLESERTRGTARYPG